MSEEALQELGLSTKGTEQNADIFMRIPGNRESVFRGAVMTGRGTASDAIQVWLDASHHSAQGKEQADLIWKAFWGRPSITGMNHERRRETEPFVRFIETFKPWLSVKNT